MFAYLCEKRNQVNRVKLVKGKHSYCAIIKLDEEFKIERRIWSFIVLYILNNTLSVFLEPKYKFEIILVASGSKIYNYNKH